MPTSLRDVDRLFPMMPMPVQQRMVLPLTTVHADLNGLFFSLPTCSPVCTLMTLTQDKGHAKSGASPGKHTHVA